MEYSIMGKRVGVPGLDLPGSRVKLSFGTTHYELSGNPEGPAVVLVSGLSVPYATWDRTAPYLAARGFRVLRYDHFGRGFSERPRCAYDLELYIGQLDEITRALGIARPLVLVGLSMGGPVAAAAAARIEGLARALILIDPLVQWPKPKLSARLLSAPLAGDIAMAFFGRRILTSGQRGDYCSEESYQAFLPSYLPPFKYPGIGAAVLRTIRSLPSWPLDEVYESLGRLGLPTLLMWGREDATIPLAQSEALLAAVPSARLRIVEDAGHVPHWERPEATNAGIEEFLKSIG
jgi:pimeloyl-ACP methyl ester carboxylesterase